MTDFLLYLILVDGDLSSVQLNVTVFIAAQELSWRLLQPSSLPSTFHLFGLGRLLFHTLFCAGKPKSAFLREPKFQFDLAWLSNMSSRESIPQMGGWSIQQARLSFLAGVIRPSTPFLFLTERTADAFFPHLLTSSQIISRFFIRHLISHFTFKKCRCRLIKSEF